jgi:N-acetylmuramoyl-L-alanine amidase CwlA
MPVIKNALTPINHRAGGCTPKWIVIHYFGALGSAASVAEWFKNPQARASAQYAVDEGDIIYRCVKDTDVAWHCGDGTLHPECRNWNSIGIEIRPSKINKQRVGAYDTDWYFDDRALENALWLVRKLMKQYNIPAENVIRHYDVSGKMCPRPFVGDDTNTYYHTSGNTQWKRFKERIDDEMVEKSKMIVNGKEVPVERILKDGTNYVKVRDIAAALNLKVSNKGNIAVLDSN